MARLGPWPEDRRVAVAVSGGADSLCLAWLAARWGRPVGLIVDHGLRRESAAEAALTAARLAGFGVTSRILKLVGLRPGAALASRARAARYAALAQACAAENLADLLLGHHLRDQAETLLIRRVSGSLARGLACMPAIATTEGVRLVRPLLGVPPADLRAVLRAQGIDWVEDPSNTDPAITRARIRFSLDDSDGDSPVTLDLAAQIRGHAADRAAEDRRLAAILAKRAAIFPEAYALVTPGPIDPAALACLIRSLAGAAYAPRTRDIGRLAADPRPCTLAGIRVLQAGRLAPGWLFTRETAAMRGPIRAEDGAIWDRRFRLSTAKPLPANLTLGGLGGDSARFRTLSNLPSAVLETLPALRDGADVIAVPHLSHFAGNLRETVSIAFEPPNPASGAPFDVGKPGDAEP